MTTTSTTTTANTTPANPTVVNTTAPNTVSLDQLNQWSSDSSLIKQHLLEIVQSFAMDDLEIRACAAECMETLEQIEDSLAASIVPLCKHSCEFVASWSCYALGKAKDVEKFQGHLAKVLSSSPSLLVKQEAAKALQNLSHAEESTMKALEQATKSTDARLQRLARNAIEIIG
ncbi:MAG: hypothetical protein U0930_11370 [Pirellulales bacterium]